jgi:hypothetical protein
MRELVLRNLDQYLSYGTLATPVVSANKVAHNGFHQSSRFRA